MTDKLILFFCAKPNEMNSEKIKIRSQNFKKLKNMAKLKNELMTKK